MTRYRLGQTEYFRILLTPQQASFFILMVPHNANNLPIPKQGNGEVATFSFFRITGRAICQATSWDAISSRARTIAE